MISNSVTPSILSSPDFLVRFCVAELHYRSLTFTLVTHLSHLSLSHTPVKLTPASKPSVNPCHTLKHHLPPTPPAPPILPLSFPHRSSPEHKQRLNSRNGTNPTRCLGTCGEPIDRNPTPREERSIIVLCMFKLDRHPSSQKI